MIALRRKNAGFTTIYKVEFNNYKKIIKVYDQIAFSSFFRANLNKYSNFYNSLNKANITPKHNVISKHILEINEIKSDFSLTKKKLFDNKKILSEFKKKITSIQKLDQSLIKKKLVDEIKKYLNILKLEKKVKRKIKKIEKYINFYEQNSICHGDIHFENLIINKNKLFILDWDYSLISCIGYEIAMFAYLEKLNQVQIKKLSKIFRISIDEIIHYLPICHLLDYLYKKVLIREKLIKVIDKKLIREVNNFIGNIL